MIRQLYIIATVWGFFSAVALDYDWVPTLGLNVSVAAPLFLALGFAGAIAWWLDNKFPFMPGRNKALLWAVLNPWYFPYCVLVSGGINFTHPHCGRDVAIIISIQLVLFVIFYIFDNSNTPTT